MSETELKRQRAGKRWTPEEDARLQELVDNGASWDAISTDLRRSVMAVKYHTMGQALSTRYAAGESLETISEVINVPVSELNEFIVQMASRKIPANKARHPKEPRPEKPRRPTVASLAHEVAELKQGREELLAALEELRSEMSKLKRAPSVQ